MCLRVRCLIFGFSPENEKTAGTDSSLHGDAPRQVLAKSDRKLLQGNRDPGRCCLPFFRSHGPRRSNVQNCNAGSREIHPASILGGVSFPVFYLKMPSSKVREVIPVIRLTERRFGRGTRFIWFFLSCIEIQVRRRRRPRPEKAPAPGLLNLRK